MVCIDGSEHSINVLSCVVELAEKMGSNITLLNVQERRLHSLSLYARAVSERLGEAILTKALDAIRKEGLSVRRRIEFGVTSDRIVEVAESGNHDLIVIGSRGLGTVKRFLLGSISDDVILKAKCSVLMVPTRHQ